MTSRLFLPALLALPLLSAAQNTDLGRTNDGNFNNGYALVVPDDGQVRGTPFLVAGWEPASVQLIGNKAPTPATLRYDVYRQELRVRRPKGDSVLVPLNRVKEFTLTNTSPSRRFVCYPAATLPADVKGACAEVLADGPHLQLLKFWGKEVVKQPGDNNSYASNSTVNVLQETTHYYLRWPTDGHLTAVRLKRSSLEQALAGQPAALAALKARKGSLSSEVDVAAAVLALDPVVAAGH
ncbi:hypothetical protein GCM10023172_37530 [Hymenobacter ginsengisoli]|uniref:Uncharacterized protein n=1 Tax=Hymenobacter ginsengisoli TaxID=1051626 RepID=A0ABP8QTD6_9BACT|nr:MULTISPECIES: hypothetical protein [unclassified Hymenobacter]MBO2032790.1 hypothetical protein [Hymenobacter sp. BT559]